MENRILFLGPEGSEKANAIRTICDIKVVDTDECASVSVTEKKENNTVAMNLGVIELEEGDRMVMYGAPEQEKTDFMGEILLARCDGIFLLIDHSAENPLNDLDSYLTSLEKNGKSHLPMLIGVTHPDNLSIDTLVEYELHINSSTDRCSCMVCSPPVQRVDARNKADINAALVTLAALIEVEIHFPNNVCPDWK